jgi:hypothetical protein
MPGEVDARLIGLLQGSMSLFDSLRDAGSMGEITVRLGREDGLMLLKLVAGANDADAEAWSQRGRPPRAGSNSLRISNLTFEWPQAQGQGLEVSHLFSPAPQAIGAASNENLRRPPGLRFYGFDEDAPALR